MITFMDFHTSFHLQLEIVKQKHNVAKMNLEINKN